MASAVILKGTVNLSKKKKKKNIQKTTKIFGLAENVKRSTSKKMNVETDVIHMAMKNAISSKLVAVPSHTSVTHRSGFSSSGMYLCIYFQRLIH